MTEALKRVRDYEEQTEMQTGSCARPLLHLTPRVGWMNDPNGFSFYQGQYHLFYQYHPYDKRWGPMHWGHAVSKDLIHWEYLPAALAPDQVYDGKGCFSGSAIELPDGRHLLMYTGIVETERPEDGGRELQVQCLAVGDGKDYKKWEKNPVLTENDLPENASRYDFRDPKIWYENGRYYCVTGNCTEERDGQMLLFSSEDGFSWSFLKTLIRSGGRFGRMWECPDFFALDGKRVAIASPQEMLPEGLEYHGGNGTLCMIGALDASGEFIGEHCHAIDYGIDFYAPQTVAAPDGRRIMIGWMQNWDTLGYRPEEPLPWFGQMSLPRELSVRDGRLIQTPVRELCAHYGREAAQRDIIISGESSLPGICGRVADLTVDIEPSDTERLYRRFEMRFVDNGANYACVCYDPYEAVVEIDRRYSGTRVDAVHQRSCNVRQSGGRLRLRLILDRFSAEVFVNDGEQVLSMALYADTESDGIRFLASGEAKVSAVLHELL